LLNTLIKNKIHIKNLKPFHEMIFEMVFIFLNEFLFVLFDKKCYSKGRYCLGKYYAEIIAKESDKL